MVKLADAQRVIAAAQKKADAIGQPMNIAVADAGGNLVAHVRMDEAWLGSIDISIRKARTARSVSPNGAAAAKYVDAFMQNANWEEVNRRFTSAQKAAAAKAAASHSMPTRKSIMSSTS